MATLPLPRPLSRGFYARSSPVVARALLGKLLVHGERAGMIVETEAYLGPEDLASHARFGPTRRNQVMFGPAGIAYVYLCYGMYELFNVVTGPPGQPQAVLIRALMPVHALPDSPEVARGPGKLTRALQISRKHTGFDLTTGAGLYLQPGSRISAERIRSGPRVGVSYAGEWAAKPLRFWIQDHPAVSRGPSS